MAVTSPPFLYVKQPWDLPTDMEAMLYDLTKFLTDEHATQTGPAWTVVCADDASRIDTPAGGNFLANLDTLNDWSTGNANTPVQGAWICLESLDATTKNGTNHFQAIIKASTGGLGYLIWLMPNQNFVVPGSTTSTANPTVPADSLGESGGYFFGADIGVSYLNMNADEGMAVFLLNAQAGNDTRFFYLGELDGSHESWTRPYALSKLDFGFWSTNAADNYMSTLFPDDGVTPCLEATMGFAACPDTGGNRWMSRGTRKNLLGVDPIFPVSVATYNFISFNSRQLGFRGYLRNVRDTHEDMPAQGTIDSMNWVHANEFPGSHPAMAIRWDGATAYP